MFLPLLLLPLVVVALVGVGTVLLVLLLAQRGSILLPAVAQARRHGLTVGVLAWVTGGLGAAVTAGSSRSTPVDEFLVPGATAVLAVAAFGIGHNAVIALGDVTWPRARGEVRTATLVSRSWRDTTPVGGRRLLAIATLSVVVAAGIGMVTDDGDGRSVGVSWTLGELRGSSSAGPYPGEAYAVPALLGAALLVVLTGVALQLVVLRPSVPGADPATESALRRASAHRLVRGGGASMLALGGGLWATGGAAVVSLSRNAEASGVPVSMALPAAVGTVAVVLGLLHLLASAVVLIRPAPRVPRPTDSITGTTDPEQPRPWAAAPPVAAAAAATGTEGDDR